MKPVSAAASVHSSHAVFLNVGCGHRFSRDPRWVNIDLVPAGPEVRPVDAAIGLPFLDNTFAAVYHSHVLEHLDGGAGRKLLRECFRVLQPGGVVRVVVPDLERIATGYLERLTDARSGREGARRRYTWAVLELCDQMTRRQSGGGVLEFLADPESEGRAYAEERCGAETRAVITTLDRSAQKAAAPLHRRTLRVRARELRERLIRQLLGKDYRALQVGRFAVCGELHRWMYDSFSLTELLKDIGFHSVQVRSAVESYIDGWAAFALDADASAVPHKPDSLFMEACKPTVTQ
ncbi:MAG: methyltransferase domain-containing protein [Chthoniobacteraceae bacterium]